MFMNIPVAISNRSLWKGILDPSMPTGPKNPAAVVDGHTTATMAVATLLKLISWLSKSSRSRRCASLPHTKNPFSKCFTFTSPRFLISGRYASACIESNCERNVNRPLVTQSVNERLLFVQLIFVHFLFFWYYNLPHSGTSFQYNNVHFKYLEKAGILLSHLVLQCTKLRDIHYIDTYPHFIPGTGWKTSEGPIRRISSLGELAMSSETWLAPGGAVMSAEPRLCLFSKHYIIELVNDAMAIHSTFSTSTQFFIWYSIYVSFSHQDRLG